MVPAAATAYYRFTLLIFNCLLTFGSYFCFDMPSALQQQFQGNLSCLNSTESNETTDCVEGLGMTPQQYNLLYAIYAWTNAVVVILSGFLIDKLGSRVGINLFSFLVVLGSATFALGSHFKGTSYLLPLMLIGRLLFGSSNGSLIIAQDRIIAFWFKGRELSLAFGLQLTFSRLGSVLNFFLTPFFERNFGIQWTLWGGMLLCVLSFFSAIVVGVLDKVGTKQLGLDVLLQEESKKVRFQDIRHLSLRYWLLVVTIMFLYNGIFPFVADASKFIQDKYSGYSQQEASYIAGAIYDSSLLLFSIAGILVASLWPSVFLVVPHANIGTALGLATSVQMIGIGLCNLVVGQLLGNQSRNLKIPLWRWQQVMIFLLANIISCVIASIFLNIVDKCEGGALNMTTKRSESAQQETQEPSETSPLLRERSGENRIN
ncbi:major facilitator superfamily domain-containing protein 1 isoform X2 [Stegostoma tigrinum]|uniref:major facilitator superfamily domain-containing protein 1 isoform X2 n=1 Tax=Stegostoma tigrinum TaxID=3053191 RepID=UPI00202B7D15|nr:major facilitator superfamily domain-containing protein 1 isoform X2 [Stegostoma tigrinum]